MNALELETICNKDKEIQKYFLGVFAVNKLPKRVPYPCCIIANTQPSTHPGEHWVAIYIDEQNRGNYFCSYGKTPPPIIEQWIKKNTEEYELMSKRIQGSFSTTCGQYCLFYLHFRCCNVTHVTIASLFSSELRENDLIVNSFINGLYDQHLLVFNPNFVK